MALHALHGSKISCLARVWTVSRLDHVAHVGHVEIRGSCWIPAPDRVEGRLCAGMTGSNRCQSRVNPCLQRSYPRSSAADMREAGWVKRTGYSRMFSSASPPSSAVQSRRGQRKGSGITRRHGATESSRDRYGILLRGFVALCENPSVSVERRL